MNFVKILLFILVVQHLIEEGANIEAQDKNQRTPLHFASYYGKTDVVKYLVSKGANINVKGKNWKTPYDVACGSIRANQSQRDVIKKVLM